MAYVTFSTLDYLSGPDLLDLMRRYAKTVKKADSVGKPLGWHQNRIAISLAFKNWSQLHRHLASIKWADTDHVLELVLKKPGLGQFVEDHAVKAIDEEEGTETMKNWVRAKYTPLIDFAFYDNESSNGFSWPDVDLAVELRDEFSGKYPDDLIEQVAHKLESNEGPWGLDDREGGEDDPGEVTSVTG